MKILTKNYNYNLFIWPNEIFMNQTEWNMWMESPVVFLNSTIFLPFKGISRIKLKKLYIKSTKIKTFSLHNRKMWL